MNQKLISTLPFLSSSAIFIGVFIGLLSQPVKAAQSPQSDKASSPVGWTSSGYVLVNQPLFPGSTTSLENTLVAPNICTPDTSSMISYWPLDEAQNQTTFVDVAGANDGTCTAPTCPVKTGGIVGSARDFTYQGISIPDDPTLNWTNGEAFSFELWVKTTQDCTGNKVFLGKYRNVTAGNGSWWMGCVVDPLSNHVAAFSLRDTKKIRLRLVGTSPINDGAWHHLVGVRKSGTNYLYVDGVLEASEAKVYSGDFKTDDGVTIGYYAAGSIYDYVGKVDEVAIYNKGLSKAEVKAHYNAGAGQSYCNDAPLGVDDTAQTNISVPLEILKADLLANDIDVDPAPQLSISAFDSASANGGTVVENGDNLTYTPPGNFSGTDTFTYTLTDGEFSDTATVTVNVGNFPNAPKVTNPGNQSDPEGANIVLAIEATDADGDNLTYSAKKLPPDLKINATTGVISGRISYSASSASPYEVTVTVTDDSPTNESTQINFRWVVTETNMFYFNLPFIIRITD